MNEGGALKTETAVVGLLEAWRPASTCWVGW